MPEGSEQSAAPSHPRYEVLDEIARGGMGVIYRVRDLDLNRVLAMKVLLSARKVPEFNTQQDYFARFLEEVQVTALLDHPAIVPVHDLGFNEDGTPFYTMRFVKGRDLGEIISEASNNEETFRVNRLIEVLIKVCQALTHAHDKGVLHRDLKPSNIMVGELGEVYLMDWGLARVMRKEDVRDMRLHFGNGAPEPIAGVREGKPDVSIDAPLMTMDGGVIGTPAYMSPEQAAGRSHEIDRLSDVYALGAILYQVLSGHPPYMPSGSKVTAREVLTDLREGPPDRIRRLDARMSPELVAICEKSMARERKERYTSALELADDLQAYLDGRVVQAHRTGAWVELTKWFLRNRAFAAAAVLLAMSVVAFAIAQLVAKQQLDRSNLTLTETLAESYTNQGFSADSPERAALWFGEAAALKTGRPKALRASRARIHNWTQEAYAPLRAFRLERNHRPQEVYFHPELPMAIVESFEMAEVWDLREREEPLLPGMELRCAAWDPVSGMLATSVGDDSVVLWNSPGFEEMKTLRIPGEHVSCLAFHENGEVLGVGGRSLSLWSLTQTSWIGESRPHDSVLASISFDSSGEYVATASGDEARLYALNAETSVPLHTPFPHYRWREHAQRVFRPVFRNGCLLTNGGSRAAWIEAYRNRDYALRFWDLKTGAEVKRVDIHPLRMNPNGRNLRGGRGMWDLSREGYSIDLFGLADRSVFHPDGSTLFGWRDHGTAIDLRSGAHLGTMGRDYSSTTYALGMASHGRYLASVFLGEGLTSPATVVVFRAWKRPRGVSIVPSAEPWNAIAKQSVDGRYVAFPGVPGLALETTARIKPRVYDAATGEPAGPCLETYGEPLTGTFVGEHHFLLATGAPREERERGGYRVGHVQLWDWRNGEPVSNRLVLPSEARDLALAPDGSWIAVLCHDRTLLHIDANVSKVREIAPGSEPFQGAFLDEERLMFLPDGSLVYAGHRGRTHLLSPEALAEGQAPRLIASSEGRVHTRANCAGRLLSTNARSLHVEEVDLERGESLPPTITGASPMTALAWEPFAQLLFTGERSGIGQVWRWNEGEQPTRLALREHENEVSAAAFVPGEPWILSHAEGTGLSLWDRDTGRAIAPQIASRTHERQQILFAERGSLIVTPFNDRALVLAPEAWEPDNRLDLDGERLLAEIHNHGVVNEHGVFERISREAWMSKWQSFRERYPHYHDAQLTPSREEQALYHREQALRFSGMDVFAYRWHLDRWASLSEKRLESWVRLLDLNQDVPNTELERLLVSPIWNRDVETLSILLERFARTNQELSRRAYLTLADALHQTQEGRNLYPGFRARVERCRNAVHASLDMGSALDALGSNIPDASKRRIREVLTASRSQNTQ